LRKSLDLKYFLIGEGPETPILKELTNQLKLDKEVIFLGACDTVTRNMYYKLSDLFILIPKIDKSSIEGFGIVYIEANSFSLPVIGSFSGGIREAIINGKTGFLVKSNNEEDLRDKILLLFNNEKMRSDLGNYGYERVKNLYNWENIAKIYQKMLRSTIKQYRDKLDNL